MAITTRPVVLADVPAMAKIRAREWGTETYWLDRIGSYLSGKLSPKHALPARAAFAAIDGTQLAGFVAGHRTRRFACDGELEWINVAEQWRAQGVAGRLIAEIGACFVHQEAVRICVNVEPTNVAAQRLYTRRGAQTLNDHWMVWKQAAAMCTARNE